MAVWSSLTSKGFGKLILGKRIFASFKNWSKEKVTSYVPLRNCHQRTFPIKASDYDRLKLKDLVYLYLTIGSLPLLAVVIYCNIFIGPATLALIPEGYEPKPWEYFRHPITRFFAKYVTPSYQEMYERTLHNLFEKAEKKDIRQLQIKVEQLIKTRQDYQAWYYEAPSTTYLKDYRELSKKHMEEFTQTGTMARP